MTTYADAVVSEVERRLRDRLAAAGDAARRLGDPAELAERWVATLPLAVNPVEDLAGPFYDTTSLARWLGVSRQALDSRVRSRSILGLPTEGGSRVYPAQQFRAAGAVVPHLAAVLHALAGGVDDPWTWALWLAARDPGGFDGLSAYEWLAAGRDPAPLLAEARADARRWAA